jgi:hypothetical protein
MAGGVYAAGSPVSFGAIFAIVNGFGKSKQYSRMTITMLDRMTGKDYLAFAIPVAGCKQIVKCLNNAN